MSIDINSTVIKTDTTFKITDSSNNVLLDQSSTGEVNMPKTSGGSTLVPLFNVGMNSVGWTDLGGVVQWTYTAGSGYTNIGSCFNTGTGSFTAPWTGLYLFKQHIYCYGPDGTVYTWYFHPLFLVNGSTNVRRPGGTPYRIRQYGLYPSYGQDSDCCELIYLTAGDYVQVYTPRNGTMQGNGPYSTFSGAYLGN